MRVGVYLGDWVPEAGGGHTFVSQVFDAFLKAARASAHEFVVFCGSAVAESLRGTDPGANVQVCALPARGAAERAAGLLKNYSPLFAGLYRRPSRLERAALRRKVELIWFVGDAVSEMPDIPYIATVWDIQHRTHPWFPEVSSGGVWDYRENIRARRLRRAAYVITGTPTGREQLGWHYQIPPERIRVFPHPTPAMSSNGREATPAVMDALANTRFIFYPAQFWPHKNHVNLLHAFRLLLDRYGQKLSLVLVGSDKGNLAHVKAAAQELRLGGHVHFPGFVATADLAWLYENAAALVYPSFSGPENLPPLEAFSVGCPVANAEYPGAREQLEDAAVYFDPADPESIARAVNELLSRADLREELVRRGRECAARRTADKYVAGVLAVFDEFAAVRRSWN